MDLQPGMKGQTAFDIFIEKDIKEHKPGTYLLTGGVGSGKTTFLRRFAQVVQPAFVKQYCVWLPLDFLSIGNVSPERVESELREYAFRGLRGILQSNYDKLWPKTADDLKVLFAEQLKAAELTSLAGLHPDSPERTSKVGAILERCFAQDELIVQSVLVGAAKKGYRPVIVLDNTDQQGERFQESVFLMSQRLSKDCAALTIVAIREEKFFAAYRRGIFDAYGDRRFHVGSPSLNEVIRKRLDYATQKCVESMTAAAVTDAERAEGKQIELVMRTLIRSTAVAARAGWRRLHRAG